MKEGICNFIDESSTLMEDKFWTRGQLGHEALSFWREIKEKGGFKGPSEFWRVHSLAQYEKCLELRSGDIPKTCLEIGGGDVPRIYWIPVETKIALDPLMALHVKLFPNSYENIACMMGVGEWIPIQDNTIDYVVLSNCLDHFSDPRKGFTEVLRVMSVNGVCFIGLEVFNPLWKLEHKLRDRVHKYRWTAKDQKRFLESCGAMILDFCIDPPVIKEYMAKHFTKDWKSKLAVSLGRYRVSWIFVKKK